MIGLGAAMDDESPYRPSGRSLDHGVQLAYSRVDALIAAHKAYPPPPQSTLSKIGDEELEVIRLRWYGLIDAKSQGEEAFQAELKRLFPPEATDT
jgi:hypothetical protein